MGKHRTKQQDELMIDFMKSNVELAKGRKTDKAGSDAKWLQLTRDLNSIGPPKKDVFGWKKTWSDWKVSIRKKLASIRARPQITDDGSNSEVYVTPMEEEIATLCGMYNRDEEDESPKYEVSVLKEEQDEASSSESSFEQNPLSDQDDDEQDEPPPKRQRSISKTSNSETIYATQAAAMEKIAMTLETMSVQQTEHIRRIEKMEREKLNLLKQIVENFKK